MIRTIFTLEELRYREKFHRTNSQRSHFIPSFHNKSTEQRKAELEEFKRLQAAMADAYAELISYRENDASYVEGD